MEKNSLEKQNHMEEIDKYHMDCIGKRAWQMRGKKVSENKNDLSIIYIFFLGI
jgi:hypothetical protein